MGFDLNDMQVYSALEYHQLRIAEVESFWKRFGFWLAACPKHPEEQVEKPPVK